MEEAYQREEYHILAAEIDLHMPCWIFDSETFDEEQEKENEWKRSSRKVQR